MSNDTDKNYDPLAEAIRLSEKMALEIRNFRSDLEELKEEMENDDDGPDSSSPAAVEPVNS